MRTLYRNGRVYTPAARDATALLIENDLITWIGDESGVTQHADARMVDLAGAFVTPAFVDAHVHLTATGIALTGLDLAGAGSLGEALARVAAAANDRRVLIGGGWDETQWPERRPPTAAELDRATGGAAVYLARVDGHSAVASSGLLDRVPGARTLPGHREDGWLSAAAHHAARQAAYTALGAQQVADLQRAALHRAAGIGIACVHEMAGPEISGADDLASALALGAHPDLPEVIGYWGELGGVDAAQELGAVGAAGDLFCDGSLGSHTAALREPYADAPDSRGELRFATEQLVDHLVACNRAGIQAGFHVIGDAAIDQVIEAVETATQRLGRPAGAGHRVEHVEFVHDPSRLAATGLLASMQPLFDASWGGPDGMYAARLGAQRAGSLNRFAELAAAGVPLAFGSDAPVTGMGPWEAVRAAAFPTDPTAAISARAAFAAHTRAGWRAARREGDGVLLPGAAATLAIWRTGPLAVDVPDDRVARWSTDPRAAVPGLPEVAPGVELPTCLATVRRGVALYDAGILS